MRIHIGPIPDEFTPDNSWRPIREPAPVMMQVLATPIGLAVFLAVLYCWHRIGASSPLQLHGSRAALLLVALFLSFPLLIIIHEILHALVHPHFGRSALTVLGAWPKPLMFYAHYSGPLTRNRFLAVFAMPFLVITILPLIIGATGLLPPTLTMAAAWFSSWNAFFACGDIFGFALILFQVPSTAIVQNQSYRTYWKSI